MARRLRSQKALGAIVAAVVAGSARSRHTSEQLRRANFRRLFSETFLSLSLFSVPIRSVFSKPTHNFPFLARQLPIESRTRAQIVSLSLCFGRRRRRNDRCNPLAGLAARINLASNATSQAQATFAHFRRRNHAPQRSARKTKPNVSLSASHFWQASGDCGGDNKGAKLQSKRRILAPPPPQTQ